MASVWLRRMLVGLAANPRAVLTVYVTSGECLQPLKPRVHIVK